MHYQLLTTSLLVLSFWLTLTTRVSGQGDFDPAYFQRSAVESVVSESEFATFESLPEPQTTGPIGSSFFEDEQPVSQVSFSGKPPARVAQGETYPTIEQYEGQYVEPYDGQYNDQYEAPRENFTEHYVGTSIRLMDRAHFFVEYRPFRTSAQEVDAFVQGFRNQGSIGEYQLNPASNDLVLGLRFEF